MIHAAPAPPPPPPVGAPPPRRRRALTNAVEHHSPHAYKPTGPKKGGQQWPRTPFSHRSIWGKTLRTLTHTHSRAQGAAELPYPGPSPGRSLARPARRRPDQARLCGGEPRKGGEPACAHPGPQPAARPAAGATRQLPGGGRRPPSPGPSKAGAQSSAGQTECLMQHNAGNVLRPGRECFRPYWAELGARPLRAEPRPRPPKTPVVLWLPARSAPDPRRAASRGRTGHPSPWLADPDVGLARHVRFGATEAGKEALRTHHRPALVLRGQPRPKPIVARRLRTPSR